MAKSSKSKRSETAETDTQSVEQWSDELNTRPAIFASAKVMHRWAEGRQMTKADYKKAIREAGEEVIE